MIFGFFPHLRVAVHHDLAPEQPPPAPACEEAEGSGAGLPVSVRSPLYPPAVPAGLLENNDHSPVRL